MIQANTVQGQSQQNSISEVKWKASREVIQKCVCEGENDSTYLLVLSACRGNLPVPNEICGVELAAWGLTILT